jgi:hypothetical protein
MAELTGVDPRKGDHHKHEDADGQQGASGGRKLGQRQSEKDAHRKTLRAVPADQGEPVEERSKDRFQRWRARGRAALMWDVKARHNPCKKIP